MTRPPDSNHHDDSAPPHDAMQPSRATPRSGSTRRLNGWVVSLVCVIITGAFAFSAESWIGLAETTGFRASADAGRVVLRLSWVLPIAVDGYLCLTTWLFLSARPGSALRRYAGWSVLVVVVLSVIAQGVYHGLEARGMNVAEVWPLVVAVGGLPPALLASSVHLLSVYLHYRPEEPQPTRSRRPRATRQRTSDSRGVAPAPRWADAAAESTQPAPGEAPRPASQRLSVVGAPADSDGKARIDDATLADAIRDHVLTQRRLGAQPVQRAMQRLVRERTGAEVGQRRCVRVAESITDDDSGESADDDEEREPWAA